MSGRPTACTPTLTERVCRLLRQGHYRSVAARAVGMGMTTFQRWMSYEDDLEPYRTFRLSVLEAEKLAERRLFNRVLRGTKGPTGDPKLALEVLARKFPARYGRRDHQKHAVEVTDVTGTEDPRARLARLESLAAAIRSSLPDGDD